MHPARIGFASVMTLAFAMLRTARAAFSRISACTESTET
jgi:hypothetical protein